jgi:hypothetical protein
MGDMPRPQSQEIDMLNYAFFTLKNIQACRATCVEEAHLNDGL